MRKQKTSVRKIETTRESGTLLLVVPVGLITSLTQAAYIPDDERSPKGSASRKGIFYLNLLSLFVNPFLPP